MSKESSAFLTRNDSMVQCLIKIQILLHRNIAAAICHNFGQYSLLYAILVQFTKPHTLNSHNSLNVVRGSIVLHEKGKKPIVLSARKIDLKYNENRERVQLEDQILIEFDNI